MAAPVAEDPPRLAGLRLRQRSAELDAPGDAGVDFLDGQVEVELLAALGFRQAGAS
ncbi:MAG: hypothetical protein AVDCRST_MAG10-933 [uncultured Acidimicrobiales bacterium]|uniref:Uncharacterized protein n=1 Tax=uncultured Acidimicrobiales bacterium TaxID=310071 RepID=A0A6J4HMA4_9ACTN|nr:MAG: hypothetical protein AVDCRST_MAG10-933 [uncultured Acidimicrobiales bacterium]